jgi:aminomethyltransferase
VSVSYIAPELPNLQIQGPRSRELLRTLTDADVDALRYFRFLPEPVTVGGVPVWLSRTGFSGELGFELFLRPEHADDLWAAVEAAGATPYGVEVIEPLRVETGMIVTGYDYVEHERTPYDLGLDRVVALGAPGAFMGKDRLIEVAADPPNRFKTLRVDGDALPEYGASITSAGEEVGVLTSPAMSPTLGNIGLAILRSDVAVDGGAVEVALGDGTVAATIDVLAVYDPQKRRPRS